MKLHWTTSEIEEHLKELKTTKSKHKEILKDTILFWESELTKIELIKIEE